MVKSIRIQEKARGVGFDWDDRQQVWDKVQEELMELKTEVDKGDEQKTAEEFGDLIFSLINYARFVNVNPEDALEKTNKKFIQRFQYMEKQIKAKGQELSDLTLEEMDVYWNEAKTI
jgi:XTP/dITP diphosphohydrolase